MFGDLMRHLIHIFNLFYLDEILSCYIFFFGLAFEVIEYFFDGVALGLKYFFHFLPL